ncbi:hypothetical protein KWH29_09260 [Xanthomonas campestris pv. paulliniae]|uniref:hypothetical protein n=1 Tax=Xanthomonas euvesicatoria TaxID=456327 RepID=UPI001C44A152|nr:hypothetical protein [Xanthomonas euvesicatoria]MBV6845536.1 hypothetical protein [Xanthomonas campestris pv. paulliniae]
MATAGSIVVELLAKTGSFETDMGRASKSTRKFGKESQDTAANVGAAFGKMGGVAAAGIAIGAAAVVNWTRELSVLSGEIERMARLSGTSEQTFQRLAAGAATVGVDQGKLADIFKDTQEKIGTFLQTGGGELQDFFTKIAPKVGLTAKEFRNLSGPEALGKYYSALEKAGVPQADMVAYLEAIASDATLLAPLLAKNGEGFRKWGDEAERLGVIMDEGTSKSFKEMREQTAQMDLMFQGLRNQIGVELLPQMKELTAFMSSDSTKNAFVSLSKWMAELTASMATGIVAAVNYADKLRQIIALDNGGAVGDAGAEALKAQLARVDERLAGARARTSGSFGLPLTDRQELLRAQQINDLVAERAKLLQGIEVANRPKVKLLENGALPDDSALIKPADRPQFKYDDPITKAGSSIAALAAEQARAMEDINSFYTATDEKVAVYIASMEKELALHGQIGEAARAAYDIQSGAFGALSEEQAWLIKSYAQTKDAMDDYAAIYEQSFGSTVESTKQGSDMMKEFGLEAARSMQGAFAEFLFDPFDEGLGGMVEGFAKTIQRMMADLAASQLLKALGSMAASSGNSWVAAIGGAIAGGRAGGGPVAAGSIYEVGEGGRPEMYEAGGRTYMIPGNQGGRVVPITAGRTVGDVTASAAGGVSVNITNVINSDGTTTTTTETDENAMMRALTQMIQPVVVRVLQQQMRPGGIFSPGGARG